MCAMNQFGPEDRLHKEDRLSNALRNLAKDSAHNNAPSELGVELAGAFRRHHRRRRAKNAAIVVLAAGCFLCTTWLLIRSSQKPSSPVIVKNTTKETAAPHTAEAGVPKNIDINPREVKNAVKHGPKHQALHEEPQVAAREAGDFLPLPSYDSSIATNNDLQIIRVEMPIQDLRLVGAPVNAAIPNRPVLADFVVGRDGTPYAVRLVQ